jgi:hypothetical protein
MYSRDTKFPVKFVPKWIQTGDSSCYNQTKLCCGRTLPPAKVAVYYVKPMPPLFLNRSMQNCSENRMYTL